MGTVTNKQPEQRPERPRPPLISRSSIASIALRWVGLGGLAHRVVVRDGAQDRHALCGIDVQGMVRLDAPERPCFSCHTISSR